MSRMSDANRVKLLHLGVNRIALLGHRSCICVYLQLLTAFIWILCWMWVWRIGFVGMNPKWAWMDL